MAIQQLIKINGYIRNDSIVPSIIAPGAAFFSLAAGDSLVIEVTVLNPDASPVVLTPGTTGTMSFNCRPQSKRRRDGWGNPLWWNASPPYGYFPTSWNGYDYAWGTNGPGATVTVPGVVTNSEAGKMQFTLLNPQSKTMLGTYNWDAILADTSNPVNISHIVLESGLTVTPTQAVYVPPPAPVITSYSVSTGTIGTPVTITGANFAGYIAVAFNGIPATPVTYNSPTSITVNVPVSATTGTITVTNVTGTTTGPIFTVS